MSAELRRALGVLLILMVALPAGASARPFAAGFTDGFFGSTDAGLRAAWFDRAVQTNSDIVELTAVWEGIAPGVRPAGFEPTSPGDPAYRWDRLDAAVRDAAARDLDILMIINRAPAWAETGTRRPSAELGTWRPNPTHLGRFARAVALRYDGAHGLPRVRNFQIWAEPNLDANLTPQWVRRNRRFRAEAPVHYRRMLNAAAAQIKAVRRDATVIAGGTAPYGDLKPGGGRIAPMSFIRTMLCLKRNLRRGCKSKSRFDGFAHDPYSVGSPQRHAINRDDVSINDVEKITRALRAARRAGTVTPRRAKSLWVSEVSWDSSPPDPDGVPRATHARWAQEALEILWRKGARTVIWFQIADAAPNPSFGSTYQSGVYFRDGRPKLTQRAFRFPLVVRAGRYWGRSPGGNAVTVERKTSSGWRVVARPRVGEGRVFTGRVRAPRRSQFRARTASDSSLTYRVR